MSRSRLASRIPGYLTSARHRRRGTRRVAAQRLSVEQLEVRHLLATIPLTIDITQIHTINDADPDVIFSDDPDYYAVVTIDGNPEQVSGEVSGQTIHPRWSFSALVDTADSPIRVDIELWDKDGGLRFDDYQLDISLIPGRKHLSLLVDPITGMYWEDGGSRVAPDFTTEGDGDGDSARLFFGVDSDGDAIYNHWEMAAQDFNLDGFIDLDLPAAGANPARKDLFVEVDSMTGRAPVPLSTAITGATLNCVSTCVRQITSPNHGLTTGDRILVDTVGNSNTLFTVTRLSNNRFQLDDAAAVPVTGSNWSLADLAGTGLATDTSLDLVINAFLNAPVPNPDGTNGIRLHVQLDETLPLVSWDTDADGDGRSPYTEDLDGDGNLDVREDTNGNLTLDPGEDLDGDGVLDVPNADCDRDGTAETSREDCNGNGLLDLGDPDDQAGWLMYRQQRQNVFGTVAERTAPNADTILWAKEQVYRYSAFSDFNVTGPGLVTGTSGWAFTDSDFLVSLGRWTPPGGSPEAQAGTFMHELGHTLGFGHGGSDGLNNKPNYFSVMSYTWQVPDGRFPGSWQLDYSIGAAPSLNEAAPNENIGLGGTPNLQTEIGPPLVPPGSPSGTPPANRIVSQTGPLDYDADGTIANPGAPTDLNFDGTVGSLLLDSNDWGLLDYRIDDLFTEGSGAVTPPTEPEFTHEQYLEQSQTLLYALPAGNGADRITLRRQGDDLVVSDDATGAELARRSYYATQTVLIVGQDGESDRLTVDFSGGNPLPGGGVDFHGGSSPLDELAFAGPVPSSVTYESYGSPDHEAGEVLVAGRAIRHFGLERVRGVAPALTTVALDASAIDEGGWVTLQADFVDAGSLATHRVVYDWGDGTQEEFSYGPGTRVLSESHPYTTGGVYQIQVLFTGDDTGAVTAATTAYISGVGIVGHRLYVIGTNGADDVQVHPHGGGRLKVHASFLAERHRTLSNRGVEQIVMLLCDGNDRGFVGGAIDLPVQIHGGDGDDQLNGGGGMNILLGGAGADSLTGGQREDLLIGGDGGDRLQANGGANLVIAGQTTYDGLALAQIDTLFAILADFAHDRVLEVEHVLDQTTVLDDGWVDELLGVSVLDQLFYEQGRDRVPGRR